MCICIAVKEWSLDFSPMDDPAPVDGDEDIQQASVEEEFVEEPLPTIPGLEESSEYVFVPSSVVSARSIPRDGIPGGAELTDEDDDESIECAYDKRYSRSMSPTLDSVNTIEICQTTSGSPLPMEGDDAVEVVEVGEDVVPSTSERKRKVIRIETQSAPTEGTLGSHLQPSISNEPAFWDKPGSVRLKYQKKPSKTSSQFSFRRKRGDSGNQRTASSRVYSFGRPAPEELAARHRLMRKKVSYSIV